MIVWKEENILLDGHNRYAWCTKHGYSFDVVYERCANEEEAKRFIILNQLGRRNLSPDAASILRGQYLESMKKKVPNPEGVNQHKEVKGNSCPQPNTAESIAKQTGVSPRTVKNDAQFYRATEELGITKDVMAGEDKRPRKEIIAEAKVKKEGSIWRA